MKKFLQSVGFGLAGLMFVTRTESNMRWHWLAAVVVAISGFCFGINPFEWALVVGCIGLVFALECFNTSIERLADRVTDQEDPLIKQSKDAAAGAVLAASIASAVIGAIVFLPRLWALFQ